MRWIVLAALCASAPLPALAQTERADDVVIMRRVLVEKAKPQAALPVVEVRTGTTFGWYAYCAGTATAALCVGIPEVGGTLSIEEDSRCMQRQSVVHDAFRTAQSLLIFGDAGMLKAPGAMPVLECGSSPTLGFGYSCSQQGAFNCYAVDRQTYSLSGTEASNCAAPQKAGDFSGVLTYWNLKAPGVDPAKACAPVPLVGREDRCEWRDSGRGDGTRVNRLAQSCFSVDKATRKVTATDMSACTSSTYAVMQEDKAILDSLGLVMPKSSPMVYCGNDQGYDFTSKVVSDATTPRADGTVDRRIEYSYRCTRDGADVDMVNCTVDLGVWSEQSRRYAADHGYTLTVSGDSNAHVFVETYNYRP